MKRSKLVTFLRSGLFLVLVASLVLNLVGCKQQTTPTATNIKVIRHIDLWPYYTDPAVETDKSSGVIACNLYDTLVFPNTDGSVKPSLATSWVISKDALTYTFTLRSGVKFHNGDALTAADVVFSLQRLVTIGQGYAYLFTGSFKAAKALSTYKVQITLKQPFGPFLGALVRLYIVDKKQVMAHLQTGTYGAFKDYGKGWLVAHDAGSGPYKVKTMKTAESLLMEKFNGYWAGWANKDAPQYVEEITDNQAITVRTLMSRGALEITDEIQTNENLAAICKLPHVAMNTYYAGSVMSIMLNTKKAPTDDIHFRKALSYCVDYQTVISNLYPGSHRSGPVAASTPGYNPNLKLYTFDLVKALAELKQSKYYGKLNQYPCEIAWCSELPMEEKVALMVQANAAKIGIKVNITKAPWLSLCNLLSKESTTPNGSVVKVNPDYAEAGSMLKTRYDSSSCGTWQQGEWLQDPAIDKSIADALATVDQKARFEKYRAIEAKIFDLCPSIWLFDEAIKEAYRTDYFVYPTAVAAKQGKLTYPILSYVFYYRDFQVFPEKANKPYTPFKP